MAVLGNDARAVELARGFQTVWGLFDSNRFPIGQRVMKLPALRQNPRLKPVFHEGTAWVFRIDLPG